MPSEKAKENKTLTAACAACGKTVSTELLIGKIVGRGRHAKVVPICQACLDRGWTPQEAA
jgi:hypothetical protein